MLRTVIFSIVFVYTFNINAQDLSSLRVLPDITLVAPDKTRGSAVMKALNERQSIREFAATSLRPQDLSDLLWAANGVNRDDGRRTAPSTRNLQEVEIYVAFAEGIYHYNAAEHVLKFVVSGDYRPAVAGSQTSVATAPISILLVADMNKFGDLSENSRMFAAIDVGIVSQNISIACAALGLATVPRGTMVHQTLRSMMRLSDMQLLMLNHPVGYPAN